MCVRHSIFYVCVTCCDLDVNIRLSERAREKARGVREREEKREAISTAPCMYHPKEKKK